MKPLKMVVVVQLPCGCELSQGARADTAEGFPQDEAIQQLADKLGYYAATKSTKHKCPPKKSPK